MVVMLHTIEPLSLVDLRHDGPVRIGAPTAVTHDADHRAGKSVSAATYANVPDADGLLEPLLAGGVLRMTHPDQPNHPDQAYVLTEAGVALKAHGVKGNAGTGNRNRTNGA